MKLVADDVQTLVIPGIGHWLAEQAPEEMTAALTEFLTPYRDGDGATDNAGSGLMSSVDTALQPAVFLPLLSLFNRD